MNAQRTPAQSLALGLVLANYPDLPYTEVLGKLEAGDHEVWVWQPLENWPRSDVAEQVENNLDAIQAVISPYQDALRELIVAIKEGDPQTIANLAVMHEPLIGGKPKKAKHKAKVAAPSEIDDFTQRLAVACSSMQQNDAVGQTIGFVRRGSSLVAKVIHASDIDLARPQQYEVILFDGGNTAGDVWKHAFFPKQKQHFFVNETEQVPQEPVAA